MAKPSKNAPEKKCMPYANKDPVPENYPNTRTNTKTWTDFQKNTQLKIIKYKYGQITQRKNRIINAANLNKGEIDTTEHFMTECNTRELFFFPSDSHNLFKKMKKKKKKVIE